MARFGAFTRKNAKFRYTAEEDMHTSGNIARIQQTKCGLFRTADAKRRNREIPLAGASQLANRSCGDSDCQVLDLDGGRDRD